MLQSVRQRILHYIEQQWRALGLVFICILTLMPGLFLSFEDSEIWGITSSRRFIDDIESLSSAHFKPLFSGLFGLIVHLAPSDWSALVASRWVALLIASGGLFSLYSIALNSFRPRQSPILVILVLSLFTTLPVFLVHFPKVRSDSIAASIALIGYFLLQKLQQNPHSKRLPLLALTYAGIGLVLLLVTPKSVDLVAALAVIFWFSSAQPRVHKLAWIALPAAGILLAGLLVGRESMARVLLIWLDSYRESPLWSELHWTHIWISLVSAPISHLILFVGLCFSFLKFKQLNQVEKSFILAGSAVLLFVFFHSQKFHFFLASRVPFLALAAMPGILWLLDYLKSKQIARSNFDTRLPLILAALWSITLAFTTLRLELLSAYEMRQQRVIHEELRQFLRQSGSLSYWDGIGLFPKLNTVFHYPSPGDRENSQLLRYAEMSKPNLVIRTSKMELLEPELFGWLTENYAAINPFVSTRIARIDRIYFRTNCAVAVKDLDQLRLANRLTGEIILLVKTAASVNWHQFPFSSEPFRSRLSEFNSLDSVVLNNCHEPDTNFALSSEQAWRAGVPPEGLFLFSYDGRL